MGNGEYSFPIFTKKSYKNIENKLKLLYDI